MSRPTVLISGAAIRLGKATAQAFFERGCNLVLHYNQSSDAAKALQQQFNQQRLGSAQIIQADLTNLAQCEKLIQFCLEQYGRLDHLINNASIFYATAFYQQADLQNAASQQANESVFELFLQTNFVSPVTLSRCAAESLKKHHGSIVNLIDIYAEAGLTEHTAYVAAKAALLGATQQLAHQLAPDIRVNGVSPGAILWPDAGSNQAVEQHKKDHIIQNTALKHLGTASNIAETIAFLALDATYTTGSIINVDGGRRDYI